jgi:hypothetical protein
MKEIEIQFRERERERERGTDDEYRTGDGGRRQL